MRGCQTEAEKLERKEMVKSARPTLKVLRNVLEKRMQDLEANAQKSEHYEKASWAYYQADHLGAMRAYNYVLSLLDQEETE